MGIFGKRREKFVDLSASYMPSRKLSRPTQTKPAPVEEPNTLGYLGDMANCSQSTSEDVSWDNEPSQPQNYENTVGYMQERKQKLAKRLLDMTGKIEDLSNQIYHLRQRMDVIERKLKINFE